MDRSRCSDVGVGAGRVVGTYWPFLSREIPVGSLARTDVVLRTLGGGLTIPVLLNEAQKSSVGPGQVRYASVLWGRVDTGGDESKGAAGGDGDGELACVVEQELHQLIVCLKWMVSLSARNVYHDRLVKFFGILASMATTRARVRCVEVLIGFLVEWSRAEGHLVRWRACQLVGNLINNMPGGSDVDGGVLDLIEGAMTRLLLQDGKPHVRAAAARYVSGSEGEGRGDARLLFHDADYDADYDALYV